MEYFRTSGAETMLGNRILGVAKFSYMWLIPKDAEKPVDKRFNRQRESKNDNVE